MKRFLLILVSLLVMQPALAKSPFQVRATAAEEVADSYQPEIFPAIGSIEVAFSPRGGARAAIVRFIGEARVSIRVAAYGLTSNEIGRALLAAKKRGVDVQVVVDREHNGRRDGSSVVDYLVAGGIPVRIDTAVKIQHNKFMIVDGRSVEQGSYNYTQAAERDNAENIVISRDNPKLAAAFSRRWQFLWNEAKEYRTRY